MSGRVSYTGRRQFNGQRFNSKHSIESVDVLRKKQEACLLDQTFEKIWLSRV